MVTIPVPRSTRVQSVTGRPYLAEHTREVFTAAVHLCARFDDIVDVHQAQAFPGARQLDFHPAETRVLGNKSLKLVAVDVENAALYLTSELQNRTSLMLRTLSSRFITFSSFGPT